MMTLVICDFHESCDKKKSVCLIGNYRKISNIRCTKSPNLNVSLLVLQLSLSNPMKPGVKSRMKMLQLHLSDRQFYCLLRCSYIRDLTVPFQHWTQWKLPVAYQDHWPQWELAYQDHWPQWELAYQDHWPQWELAYKDHWPQWKLPFQHWTQWKLPVAYQDHWPQWELPSNI